MPALLFCAVHTAAAVPDGGGIFPLVPLLDTAIAGEVRWLPDWTADMPPDAFSPSGLQRRCRAVTVRYPGGQLRLSRLRDGRLNEFPCQINGALYQAAAAWDTTGRLASVQTAFNLTGTAAAGGGAENTLLIEALAYDTNGYPTMLRLASGESYFFVSIDTRTGETIETWFAFTEAAGTAEDGTAADNPNKTADTEGDGGGEAAVAVAVFCHTIDAQTGAARAIRSLYPAEAPVETRSFDSFGNITSISSRFGEFTALYNKRGLRYWGTRAIQRDETGLPVRVSERSGGETDEFRYEYRFDADGNWTERREISMKRSGGVLVPEAGPVVSRTIDYF